MLNLQADAPVDLAETAARTGRPEEAAVAAACCLPLYERKGNQVAAAAARARLDLPPAPAPGKISDAGGSGGGMPHWGFRANQRDLPGLLLDAIVGALEADFYPIDAGRLLALGRALGQLGRVASEDPDFQVKIQDSRDALAAAVQAVLAEATEEAGGRPLDPELLATLTEALAAAFDQGR